VNGAMRLNEFGEMVNNEWLKTPRIRHEIILDSHVVMPNHFHAVVILRRGDRPVAPTNNTSGPKPRSIGSLVAGFKFSVTKGINETRKMHGVPVWQRNYYEHVIGDDDDLNRIREYIEYNPARWAEDEENPSRIKL
jgi:REP element-mobilizing transposase RayT